MSFYEIECAPHNIEWRRCKKPPQMGFDPGACECKACVLPEGTRHLRHPCVERCDLSHFRHRLAFVWAVAKRSDKPGFQNCLVDQGVTSALGVVGVVGEPGIVARRRSAHSTSQALMVSRAESVPQRLSRCQCRRRSALLYIPGIDGVPRGERPPPPRH